MAQKSLRSYLDDLWMVKVIFFNLMYVIPSFFQKYVHYYVPTSNLRFRHLNLAIQALYLHASALPWLIRDHQ